MKNVTLVLTSAGLLCASFLWGCSKEAFNRSAYESLRSVSNEENALNPSYDPDRVDDYEQYKARREGYLEDNTEKKGD